MNKSVNANPADSILGVTVFLLKYEIRELIRFLRAVLSVYIQTNEKMVGA